MVKQIAYKLFSLSLALLVLLSTVSLKVEKHYCGNKLIDISIFDVVQKCGMETSNLQQEVITTKKCCKDVVEVVEGQDELRINDFDDVEKSLQGFAAILTYSFESIYTKLPKKIIPHEHYTPPNLVYNIQLLDSVFLI